MRRWIIPDWPAPANVRALITARTGGSSDGAYASFNLGDHVGDDPERVARNRSLLREHLPDEPKWLDQVHGTRVAEADFLSVPVAADASVAREANVVCAVLTADCLPVLLCEEVGAVVGAVHAGWRGLCGGVIENAVAAMGARPAMLLAYLGPAIGPARYEVGDEVHAAFLSASEASGAAFKPSPAGRWLADLYELARQRLKSAGVQRIFGGGYCTFDMRDKFYSFRRDGSTGRMAALIWRSR